MVERRFARAVGSLDAMFEFISEFVETQGLDPELKYDVGLAAEELFTNLVKYGRGEQRDICMALDAEPDRLVLVIQDFDADPFLPTEHKKSLKVMGRAARFAVGAAGLAIRDSGLDWGRVDHERVGVVMGTGLVPVGSR